MKLLFTGDICFSGIFAKKLAEGKSVFSPELKTIFQQADHCIGNLEGPLVSPQLRQDYKAKIVNPPACLPYLMDCNIRVFTLANNHTFDCGQEGFEKTIDLLDEAGAQWFGAGSNETEASNCLIFSDGLFEVALLGVCFREGMIAGKKRAGVFSTSSISRLSQQIRLLQKMADKVVLVYHGEEEYTRFPMPGRRNWLHKLARSGVDAIICHHPHVPQGMEFIHKVPIFYSLGNTVFDVPGHRQRSFTDQGLLVQLDLEANSKEFRMIHLKLDREQGIISQASTQLPPESLNKWSKQKWQQDAARVFRERHFADPSHSDTTSEADSSPSPSNSLTKKLLRGSFYRTLFATLRYRNSRTIFLAAMMHKLRQRLPTSS